MLEDGGPRDVKGVKIRYTCHMKGCTQKRKMGYMEYVIHMVPWHH